MGGYFSKGICGQSLDTVREKPCEGLGEQQRQRSPGGMRISLVGEKTSMAGVECMEPRAMHCQELPIGLVDGLGVGAEDKGESGTEFQIGA